MDVPSQYWGLAQVGGVEQQQEQVEGAAQNGGQAKAWLVKVGRLAWKEEEGKLVG